MMIRPYESLDRDATASLFRECVESVCKNDYTPEQLRAWQSGCDDIEAWSASLEANIALVAIDEGEMVAFGDITPEGYLDRFFVHKDRQHQGIGKRLYAALERSAPRNSDITTHASITALPFFQSLGFTVEGKNTVQRGKTCLKNFLMKKIRSKI